MNEHVSRTVDVPRLRKLVEWVEEQATLDLAHREWEQTTWTGISSGDQVARLAARLELAHDPLATIDDLDTLEERVIRALDERGYTDAQQAQLWDEARHECGTTYCVAGKVAADDGVLVRNTRPHALGFSVVVSTGEDVDVYARHTLGLTYDEACRLFAAGNSAADVRAFAEDIAGEPL